MDDKVKSIHWSFEADTDINEIYEYYLEHSPENASQNILNLISETEKIVFTKQWQVDEFDSKFRRIIVNRKFRIVYKIIGDVILITAVYPTQKNPENFRKK